MTIDDYKCRNASLHKVPGVLFRFHVTQDDFFSRRCASNAHSRTTPTRNESDDGQVPDPVEENEEKEKEREHLNAQVERDGPKKGGRTRRIQRRPGQGRSCTVHEAYLQPLMSADHKPGNPFPPEVDRSFKFVIGSIMMVIEGDWLPWLTLQMNPVTYSVYRLELRRQDVELWVIRIRIRKGFIGHESLHSQGICFGRKVHTINI